MKKILTVLFVTLISGCSARAPVSNADVALVVEQSHTLVKAGESVTFTAHATGTAGRKEKIKWESQGGDVELLNGMERYARVEYDKPGTYAVVASLYVDGSLVSRQNTVVQVDPLM